MVKVKGTRGEFTNIEITGVGGVIARLRAIEKEVENKVDLGVIKAGAFIEDEVKESIIGKRAEPKSVDTGRFGRSIQYFKTGDAQGVVKPRVEIYPGTSTTTKDVATFMEYGTSKGLQPRRHFRNTKTRNSKKVKEIIKKEVDLAIKQQVAIGVAAFKKIGRIF